MRENGDELSKLVARNLLRPHKQILSSCQSDLRTMCGIDVSHVVPATSSFIPTTPAQPATPLKPRPMVLVPTPADQEVDDEEEEGSGAADDGAEAEDEEQGTMAEDEDEDEDDADGSGRRLLRHKRSRSKKRHGKRHGEMHGKHHGKKVGKKHGWKHGAKSLLRRLRKHHRRGLHGHGHHGHGGHHGPRKHHNSWWPGHVSVREFRPALHEPASVQEYVAMRGCGVSVRTHV